MAQSKKEQVTTRRGGVGFHDSSKIKQKKGEKPTDKKRLSMTINDTGNERIDLLSYSLYLAPDFIIHNKK